MRRLSEFEDPDLAYGLAVVLIEGGVDADVQQEEQGVSVWCIEEDDLPKALKLKKEFETNPEPKSRKDYQSLKKESEPSPRHEVIDVRTQVFGRSQAKDMTFTISLIGICVVVFLFGRTPLVEPYLRYLFISDHGSLPLFYEIRSGQVWRLVTPALMHGSWLHIGFNMLWLYSLGGQIEMVAGRKKLVILVLLCAIFSNILQYVVVGPHFLGMSGVIYGLLSYVWGKERFDPGSGFTMDRGTFGFMMIWLVLCFFGIFGPVANFAHLGGLIFGLAVSYSEAKKRRR